MVQTIVLVLLAAAVAIWFRHATTQKKQRAAAAARQGPRNSYHCVEVRSGSTACKAARDLANVRFLSDQAPRLPVSGCTAQKCTCSFIHHEDRRDDDRRHPYGQWAAVPPGIGGERRSRTERRKSQQGTFRPSIAR